MTHISKAINSDAKPAGVRLAVELRSDSIDLAVGGGGHCATHRLDVGGPPSWCEALRDWTQRHNCRGAVVDIVLQASDYRLARGQRPRVAQEELGHAVRWLLRDYDPAVLEESEFQVFEEPASRSGEACVYVAMATRSGLANLADTMAAAGLRLGSIRIPELVLARLGSRLGEGAQALLFARRRELRVIVCADSAYYAGRCVPMAVDAAAAQANDILEAREGVRSLLAYCQDRYAIGPCSLWYAAEPGAAEFARALAEGLDPPAQALPMASAACMATPRDPEFVDVGLPAASALQEWAHA